MDCIKTSKKAFASPGNIRGNVIVVNTFNLDAPSEREASSTEGSIICKRPTSIIYAIGKKLKTCTNTKP